MRFLPAFLLAFACACNSGPKNSCAPPTPGVVGAGMPISRCDGLCIDAGSLGPVCVVDCTDAGDSVCEQGQTSCVSGEPFSPKSFCLPTCGGADAGGTDAAACPSPLTCNDAGVCTP